ncbi:MAG: flagellar hook-associated protein FlgK [Polyangiaceae bacterium]
MSSLTGILYSARDAMAAQSGALQTVGSNITGANVAGYVKRTAVLETRALGAGQPGSVQFLGGARQVDPFANKRHVIELGHYGAATARADGLSGLEEPLASTNESGLAGRAAAFFGAATTLASNASDPTARAAFLARADEVASAFRTAAEALSARRTDLEKTAAGTVEEVNQRAKELSELNGKIATAKATGDEAPELRDRRDEILKELGERVGATGIEEKDGMITVLAAGTALVSGTNFATMSTSLDAKGDLAITVRSSGGSTQDVTARMTEGRIAGLIQARDTDIPALSDELDQLAFDLAGSVNAQHAAGFGADGVSGRSLFKPITQVAGAAAQFTLDAAMIGRPDRVAASSTLSGLPGGNANALGLAQIGSVSLAGAGAPAARLGGLAGHLGVLQNQAENAVELRTSTVDMTTKLREQASGVSIEEEMVDLTRYQRGFEASMRVLKTADELLETVVRELGG